jgi:hypothetical protein
MFQSCYALTSITLPASWGNIQNTSGMFGYCRNLSSIILPASWGSVIDTSNMFNNCWSLSTITLATSWGNITTCSDMFDRCFSLKEVINAEYLGTTGETQCDMSNTFKDCEYLQGVLTIGSRITKIDAYGASGYVMKLTGLRLTNNASTFMGSGPQINVSYTSLGQSALVDLFNDLPTVTGKSIDITGCPGASLLTVGERAIATGKGWVLQG